MTFKMIIKIRIQIFRIRMLKVLREKGRESKMNGFESSGLKLSENT